MKCAAALVEIVTWLLAQ